MESIIEKMLVLVLLMALGYFLGKRKLIEAGGRAAISKLVVNTAIPASILLSLLSDNLILKGTGAAVFFTIAVGCMAFYYVLGIFVPKVLKASVDDSSVYQSMTMFSNCGFMGYPVANVIFGESSAIYVTYFVIIFNIVVFSLGIYILTKGKRKFSIKRILNPAVVTSAIAGLLLLLKVRLPGFIFGTAELLETLTTPLAMIVIGLSIADVPVREVFNEWRIIPMTFIRLVIIPLLVWLILRLFIADYMMIGVATVLSGMPVAATVTMLCVEYGANDKLVAKTTFLSTVVSVVTIPLMAYFLL